MVGMYLFWKKIYSKTNSDKRVCLVCVLVLSQVTRIPHTILTREGYTRVCIIIAIVCRQRCGL